MGFHFTIGAATDAGMVRNINEDCFTVDLNLGLFVVADGVGGQNAGEVASNMAIEIIKSHFEKQGSRNEPYHQEWSHATNKMLSGIRMANSAIYESGRQNLEQRGMATTISSIHVNGDVMTLAHVGDSRIYRIRGDCLERLTNDHTLIEEQLKYGIISIEEAKNSAYRNALLRALGAEETIQIDADEDILLDHDWLLLCTDGLSNMIEEDEITKIIHSSENPQRACEKLVEVANRNGGTDNITVVLIHCMKTKQGFWQWGKALFPIHKGSNIIGARLARLLMRENHKNNSSLEDTNKTEIEQENNKNANFIIKI
jgi:protein phosphatase